MDTKNTFDIGVEKLADQVEQNQIPPPKKRAIILTAFLACLSFLIFCVNLLVSFVLDLTKNEEMWQYLHQRLNCTRTVKTRSC